MSIPRILLLGRSGQLGWALQRALSIHGEIIAPAETACDLGNPDQLRSTVREVGPAVVINAAAYTAVDRAESEPALAHQINAVAPAILAEEADRAGALMVHYSTDYVFDGEKPGAYREMDGANPLNVYGATKLEGERGVLRVAAAHLIFRTSWVYGLVGNNFPKTILALAGQRDRLRVVADQFGVPTSVDLLADVTSLCVAQWLSDRRGMLPKCGLYHLAPMGETTWHALTCELLAMARSCGIPLRVVPDAIEPIGTADYPTAARRPRNSRLDTDKLARAFGVRMPPWQWHLRRLVQELGVLQT
jgi:dTDP-4-dehydrorhamnose reductase